MRSVYKWKIGNDKYAYIANNDKELVPFIYPDPEHPYEPDEETIENYVDLLSETVYRNAFNHMCSELGLTGLGNYSEYFNYSGSACLGAGEGSGIQCPNIVFEKTKQLSEGESAYTKWLRTEIDAEGTKTFYYEIGIPQGLKGNDGMDGSAGPQGSRGSIGTQGSAGPQGEMGEIGPRGVTPEASYVSIIFKKANDLSPISEKAKLDNAQKDGKHYDDPMYGLNNIGWYDSIPATDDKGNKEAQVWMSRKTFTTDDDAWASGDERYRWSVPANAADSSVIDYEWNLMEYDEDGNLLTLEDMNRDYPPTRTSPDDAGHTSPDEHGWYDEPKEGAVWMAVKTILNGEYAESTWKISKIKGEDGNDGEPLKMGDAQEGDWFYHSVYNTGGNKGEKYNEAHVCSSDSSFKEGSEPVFKKGHLYVWDGTDEWIDAGMFNGESQYLHIKYANSTSEEKSEYGGNKVNLGSASKPKYVFLEWTGDNEDEYGEVPNGEYTGIYTSNSQEDELNYQVYKWTYSKGQDGFGYEYIYCATSTPPFLASGVANAPDIPTGGTHYFIGNDRKEGQWDYSGDTYQKNADFVPGDYPEINGEPLTSGQTTFWSDNLVSPTKELPYVYELYRKRGEDGVWSGFIGDSSTGKAALKGMYSISPEFKSTIFKRSNALYNGGTEAIANEGLALRTASRTDAGGTYDKPVPSTPTGWSDGIPSGNEVLFMSERFFSKEPDNEYVDDPDSKYAWTDPVVASDGADIDYEWNANSGWTSERDVVLPERTSPDDKNPGCAINPDPNGWWDEPIDAAIWMAQCNIKGGAYELNELGKPNWKLSRIKGEKGDKGEDGIDGQGAVFLDLTNEMDSVFLGNDKKLDIDNPMDFTTRVYIASGLTEVLPKNITVTPQGDYVGVTYSLSADTGDIKVTIQDKTVFPEEGFRFKITGALGEFGGEVTYKILGVPGGKDGTVYRVVCMPSNVSFQYYNGSYHKSTKEVSVAGYKGLEPLANCTIYYSIGKDPLTDPTRGTRVTNGKIPISDNYYTYDGKSIFVYLYTDVPNYGNMLVDRETIPVLKDGEKGEDGVGSVVMALSNPVDSVTTGDNSILDADSVVLGTYINGTYGSADVDSIVATITPSDDVTTEQRAHITTNFNSSTNYCSFTLRRGLDFGSSMNIEYYIDATGTYSDETGTHTASYKFTFRMCGVKNGPAGQEGAVLRLKASTGSIIYKNGTYDPSQISATYEQAGVEKTSGITFEFSGSSGYRSVTANTLVAISAITSAEMGFLNIKAFSEGAILDEANIPIIPAGKDGTGIVADLSSEQDLVGLGEDYIFMNEGEPGTSVTFETTVSIFNGTDTLQITSITIDDSTSGSKTYSQSSTGKKVTITATNSGKSKKLDIKVEKGLDFSKAPFNAGNGLIVPITVTAEMNNVTITRYAKYTLLGFKGGKDGVVMRIQPSVNIIKQIIDDSGLVDSYIPEKIKFNFTANGEISESGIILGYAVDKDPIIEETTSWETGKTWNTEYNLKTGFGQDIDNFIVVAAFSGNTMLDKETIPVVRNGKDGSGGDAKLEKIFKKIDSDGGAFLREFIGVSNNSDPSENNLVAFMNGNSGISIDDETVMLAAGCTSGETVGQRANSSKFQILSDGQLRLTDGNGNVKVIISPENVDDIVTPYTYGEAVSQTMTIYTEAFSSRYTLSFVNTGSTTQIIYPIYFGNYSHHRLMNNYIGIDVTFRGHDGDAKIVNLGIYAEIYGRRKDGGAREIIGHPIAFAGWSTGSFTSYGQAALNKDTNYDIYSSLEIYITGSVELEPEIQISSMSGYLEINLRYPIAYYTYEEIIGDEQVRIGLNGMQALFSDGSNLTIFKKNGETKIQAKTKGVNGFSGFEIDSSGVHIINGYKSFTFDPSTGTFK